ncbi:MULTISPECIES: peptidylprolyl isomerase [Campylobacter]|uniref:FKBP-type peptidyl-prolyl cis-trans isomerase n=1 Tax=Campylobacter TaxID=194 RepID=UPI0023F1786A|nr:MULTISPECIES: peptidylprolyl isomerase [Campylobacter]MCI6642257.1 peptidylprolyl isomerase [Campylobacter sp.]MDD7422132.1 peptidylprolyl isomerase [Campylobacter hominis]MDY3117592.1 peptidylprolyl isomerase [Campylobacter hominis]
MANNRVISMFYELKDANSGEFLESNFKADQISFLTGKDQILSKLEDEIIDLAEGTEKIVRISAKEGVGEYDESAVQVLPKEQFAGIDLKEGMELFGESEDGQTVRVSVKSIGEDDVTIDYNHPFAGRDLEFHVKIMENREATADEIAMSVPEGVHTCECGEHHHKDHECCHAHHHESGECCGKHQE